MHAHCHAQTRRNRTRRFNLSAAAIGHPYWSIDGDANARWAQFIGFWKDIGLAGGALFLLARGAGRLSLDRKP